MIHGLPSEIWHLTLCKLSAANLVRLQRTSNQIYQIIKNNGKFNEEIKDAKNSVSLIHKHGLKNMVESYLKYAKLKDVFNIILQAYEANQHEEIEELIDDFAHQGKLKNLFGLAKIPNSPFNDAVVTLIANKYANVLEQYKELLL